MCNPCVVWASRKRVDTPVLLPKGGVGPSAISRTQMRVIVDPDLPEELCLRRNAMANGRHHGEEREEFGADFSHTTELIRLFVQPRGERIDKYVRSILAHREAWITASET